MITTALGKNTDVNIGTGRSDCDEIEPYVDLSTAVRACPTVNAMSIDVEEYFQVSAFESKICRSDWGKFESRVAQNMDRIFRLLSDSESKATFFTLSSVAKRLPHMIRTIVAEGHELASHGCNHVRVSAMTMEEFCEDVSKSKKILEDVSGNEVVGYRAPSFSISMDNIWAHDVLKESGYEYSSSVYPIRHDHYGSPLAPRFPFRLENEGLLEIPLATVTVAGRNFPCAGGGYFRLLPMAYSRWALNRVNEVDNMPVAFYFHPWEIDPNQPRVTGIPIFTRFRHYVNLRRFEQRLTEILKEFRWGRMDNVFRGALSTD